jgi:signal transduction histidine kinase/ActR/RegA family two-component response regulator
VDVTGEKTVAAARDEARDARESSWLRVVHGLRSPRPPTLSWPLRLAAAPAIVCLTIIIQELVLPEPAIAPYLFFFAGIALASWMGGLLPGLLAVVLADLGGNYFFIMPYRAWSGSHAALAAGALFLVGGGIVALLCAAFRTSFIDLERVSAERKRAEEAVRESDRRKTEFLAVLSHELRNPLTPLRNGVAILERAEPGGAQARRALEIIDRQVHQLARLVDDLLDVTRVSSGKVQLRLERLDLVDVVRRAAADHRVLFAERGVELKLDLPPGALGVNGDAARLTQVIGNLLQNAAKFTPQRGTVVVSVGLERDREAVVRVRDTGAGVAPEVLTRLFQPFVQGEATLDRSRGGLGLGLALVKGLVETHGGTVAVASEGPGRGAEFSFRLPVDERPRVGEPAGKSSRLPPAARRVLDIEDNVDAAETLRDLLALSGHQVEIAFDGAAGLAAARAFLPDAVLCDVGLPGIDGYDVARALRADSALRGVLLVAVTGYGAPEDAARALEAGFDCHIAKPPALEAIEKILVNGAPPRDPVG